MHMYEAYCTENEIEKLNNHPHYITNLITLHCKNLFILEYVIKSFDYSIPFVLEVHHK